MKSEDANRPGTGTEGFREKWLSPRRKRFWLVLGVLLYTLGGFFLLPAVAQRVVVSQLQDKLGREATLRQVRFNPYTLVLEAEGFTLLDSDGVRLSGFDALRVDFEVSSLINWAWTFKEVRLDGAYLHFERFSPSDTRLSRLLDDAATPGQDASGESKEGGLPRLRIMNLALNDGRVDFLDRVPDTPVEMAVGPVDIAVSELNTLPDQEGRQSVIVQLPGDTRLTWQGSIGLAPFESEGELTVENSHLGHAIAYLKAVFPLDAVTATMDLSTRYRIGIDPAGKFGLELDGLQVSVTDGSVSGLGPVTEFFTMRALELKGGTLRYPENELRFSSVRLADPDLSARLDDEGLNLLALKPRSSGKPSDSKASRADAAPWTLTVDDFELEGGRFDFTDDRISPAGTVTLTGLAVRAKSLGVPAKQAVPLEVSGQLDEGGSFTLDGRLAFDPAFGFEGRAQTAAIPLSLGQPYLQQALRLVIENGTLDTAVELAVAGSDVKAAGSVNVSSLHVRETVEGEDLVGWERLGVDRFEFDHAARSLKLSRMTFDRPFARFKVNPDRSTNLSGLSASEATASEEPAGKPSPWSLVVGGVRINEAALDFSDLSLPLPFATSVSSMDGSLSTIDAASAEPARVQLEGQVDEFGLARIEGTINLFDPVDHTDVTVEFRNLLMSSLSPYTVEFAGQKIDEGKLNLDLRYVIRDGLLQGGNQVVLSDLVLGDRVDSPDAVSLPLELAVALLTDAEGVIDIDLPVEGDINDPEFRIGGVIWKAISGLITKVVSAPFRLLGSLVGIESEDLGQFQFLAGRSDLTAPEIEKIGSLQEALAQRPELAVEIRGPYDPDIDTPKLQFFRLRDQVIARMDQAGNGPEDESAMLDQEIRSALESLFTERFPNQSLDEVKARHTEPPPDKPDGKPVMDELAYAADLRDRLLAAEPISVQDLEALGDRRAEAIRTAFLAGGQFSEDRISVLEPVEAASEDGEWVVTELGVSAE